MSVGAKGLRLIKAFEGYERRLPDGSCEAYLDKIAGRKHWSPGYKGLWTIGYGCTVGVTEGLVWTQKQAEDALMREVSKHEAAVDRMVKYPINLNQRDALISLSYNIGSGALAKSSVIRFINSGQLDKASDAILLYNKAAGKTVRGLARRRAAERDLFKALPAAEVVQKSRKLRWLRRLRALVPAGGIFSYFTWDNLNSLRDFMSDNAGIMIVVAGGSVMVLTKIIEVMSVQDYDDGRYTPSGE